MAEKQSNVTDGSAIAHEKRKKAGKFRGLWAVSWRSSWPFVSGPTNYRANMLRVKGEGLPIFFFLAFAVSLFASSALQQHNSLYLLFVDILYTEYCPSRWQRPVLREMSRRDHPYARGGYSGRGGSDRGEYQLINYSSLICLASKRYLKDWI